MGSTPNLSFGWVQIPSEVWFQHYHPEEFRGVSWFKKTHLWICFLTTSLSAAVIILLAPSPQSNADQLQGAGTLSITFCRLPGPGLWPASWVLSKQWWMTNWNKREHYSHFTDKEIKAQRGSGAAHGQAAGRQPSQSASSYSFTVRCGATMNWMNLFTHPRPAEQRWRLTRLLPRKPPVRPPASWSGSHQLDCRMGI